MYIHKVHIQNIRSFSDFTIEFSRGEEAGWHVLIGDNGSGKSTLLRAMALGIIGPIEAKSLRINMREWIRRGSKLGKIEIEVASEKGNKKLRASSEIDQRGLILPDESLLSQFKEHGWLNNQKWFYAGFGPMRRFTGGDNDLLNIYESAPQAAPLFSLFNEGLALTKALDWLKELDYEKLKEKEEKPDHLVEEGGSAYQPEAEYLFNSFRNFINQSNLLPHQTQFKRIGSDKKPLFIDGNQYSISITELSDGYRSVLSMIFELIRQMIVVHGPQRVFSPSETGKPIIDIPGVVFIDEVDTHLHPTWQTRIGKWFTRYFPNIQFIVTTHSPLICRGCIDENGKIKGSVWQLAAPASGKESEKLTGTKLQRLIFGNILDAYSTEAFGGQIGRAQESTDLLKEYAKLDKLYAYNQITKEQNQRRLQLQKIFSTDAISDL